MISYQVQTLNKSVAQDILMTAKPSYEELEKRVTSLTQEIAACRNLQQYLHQAEETARALLNATTDSAILIDTKGKILAINETAAKRLSKYNVDMMRKNLLDILPPTLAQQRKARIDQILDSGDPLQFEDDYAGTFFLNFLYPVFDRQGKIQNLAYFSRDITAQRQTEQELRESEKRYKELSITDSLTKLYNSRHFYTNLQLEMERAHRYHRPLALLMIDVDDFKKFNDTYGHLAGDKVLAKTGEVIRNALREADTGYRYGGEEFAVILPETAGPGAVQVAERIRKELAAMPLSLKAKTSRFITASMGVSVLQAKDKLSEFIKRADENLYAAKTEGKNRVIFI
jgi:diguanylate cyclase (GGDEF)-like protein/PAS domain S-box-containing protein